MSTIKITCSTHAEIDLENMCESLKIQVDEMNPTICIESLSRLYEE